MEREKPSSTRNNTLEPTDQALIGPQVFCIKDALKTFVKFTGKRLYQSLFFNKVAGLGLATLFKKRLWRRCFSVNFAKFLSTYFLQNASRQLFLKVTHREKAP